MTESSFVDSGFAVPVFSPGDDPIACLNKAMAFLTAIASSRGKLLAQGEILQVDRQELLNATTAKVKDIWLGNALSLSDQGMQHGIRKKAKAQGATLISLQTRFSAIQAQNNMTLTSRVATSLLSTRAVLSSITPSEIRAELLVYVQDTCPNAITPSPKKVAITPMNKVKKVRFAEPLTSSSNIKQVESSNTSDSNTPVLSSTGVKCSTSNCGSKPPGNKRNDRISQTPSRNKKNKVEAQPRKVNKMNRVVKPVCDVDVKHSLSNANSEILYATCNKSMFDGVHDKCLLDLVQNGNNRRTFTIVGNSCPLTRITSTNVVPPKQTTSHSDEIQKPEIKVYSKKPKNVKNIGSSTIPKIVESKNANHSEPNQTWGSDATDIPSSSSLVMTGYPDCTMVSGLRMFETYDRESLSAHELC
ncbi:hypothetical protein Tco_0386230 [Tanacetum coccineum]